MPTILSLSLAVYRVYVSLSHYCFKSNHDRCLSIQCFSFTCTFFATKRTHPHAGRFYLIRWTVNLFYLISYIFPSYLIVFLWRHMVKNENKNPVVNIFQMVSMKQRHHDKALDSRVRLIIILVHFVFIIDLLIYNIIYPAGVCYSSSNLAWPL